MYQRETAAAQAAADAERDEAQLDRSVLDALQSFLSLVGSMHRMVKHSAAIMHNIIEYTA